MTIQGKIPLPLIPTSNSSIFLLKFATVSKGRGQSLEDEKKTTSSEDAIPLEEATPLEEAISTRDDPENSNSFDSNSSIFERLPRKGYSYAPQSTFQFESALRERSNLKTREDKRILVIKFEASWCGICKLIQPQFEVNFRVY